MSSHYLVLGVRPDAEAAEVRAAYRERAVGLHPDAGGDPERYARLQAAYAVLAAPARRAEYDAELVAAAAAAAAAAGGEDDGDEGSFAQQFRGGAFADGGLTSASSSFSAAAGGAGAGQQPAASAGGDRFGGKGLLRQLERNEQQVAVAVPKEGLQLAETSYTLSHTEGFDAWLRNHKGASQVLTGDELVKRGMIEATGSVDTVSPAPLRLGTVDALPPPTFLSPTQNVPRLRLG
eukprot:SAG22_NODE_1322_length_4755_cov_49.468428_1_plen_234_part_10